MAGLAQWDGASFHKLGMVVGSVPGQDTCLGCGFGPWSGFI